jgi:thymidine phosphorylase
MAPGALLLSALSRSAASAARTTWRWARPSSDAPRWAWTSSFAARIQTRARTVESVPLITASILSKKLAAGLQGLVLDVKCGSGAFVPSLQQARELAGSLVAVAAGAGLPTRAVITNMDQVLGHTAGNALEMEEAIAFLTGTVREPRLLEVTLVLGAQMLLLGGLVATWPDARVALRAGWLSQLDVRALGVAVVALGGGRAVPGQPVDPRVGLSQVLPLGAVVLAGQALARVHAADAAAAQAAVAAVERACEITDEQPTAAPLILVSG